MKPRTNGGFLTLPPRSGKPREVGLTHVLDRGMPLIVLRSLLDLAAPAIDILKLGWGTAYVTGNLAEKVAACRAAGVAICPGGTLLEIAAVQRKVAQFARWASRMGFDTVEVSDGAVGLDPALRRRLISDLSRDFRVLAEVGSKDPQAPVIPSEWVASAAEDLEAGAAYVIAEGRESGTVGLYRPDGSVREGLVEALLGHIPGGRIIFEAPQKAQQAWFIRRLGEQVNLGNVLPDDVLGVETLRRGLRADTVWLTVRSWTPSLVAEALFQRSGG